MENTTGKTAGSFQGIESYMTNSSSDPISQMFLRKKTLCLEALSMLSVALISLA